MIIYYHISPVCSNKYGKVLFRFLKANLLLCRYQHVYFSRCLYYITDLILDNFLTTFRHKKQPIRVFYEWVVF